MAPATHLLDDDRYLVPDPAIRQIARALYEETRRLPIVAPASRVDPRIFAENAPLADPASVILRSDEDLLRVLSARGVPSAKLREGDPLESWRLFAKHYSSFQATPVGAWLDHELYEVFGIARRLTPETAEPVYHELEEKLRLPEFRPRALFERFGCEVLGTTAEASDPLDHHRAIRGSGWKGRVIPCFAPNGVLETASRGWPAALEALGREYGAPLVDYPDLVLALEDRRAFFKGMGALTAEYAVREPETTWLSPVQADVLFQEARQEKVSAADERRFKGHLLMEMARQSLQDGLVMQIRQPSFEPAATLLKTYGNDPRFRLVLLTSGEPGDDGELMRVAGQYRAVRLVTRWWYHNSKTGNMQFHERAAGSAEIASYAGFADGSGALCSLPGRYDLARRLDANLVAGLVSRHVIGLDEAHRMARALAYDLVKDTYKL